MDRHLLMTVRLHGDGMGTARFHGLHEDEPEWPPSPGRLFQALVAGAATGARLREELVPALRWLEALPPPVIVAPPRTAGQRVSVYVPNNDADALADPTDLSGIRTAKRVEPSLFDASCPIHYAWPIVERDAPVDAVTRLAHSLYQFGRGPDMAWADVRVVGDDDLRSIAVGPAMAVHRPVPHGAGRPLLACPVAGTLDSLVARHAAPRLRPDEGSKSRRTLFTNAPKPRFASVSYARERRLALYELRERGSARLWPWPMDRAASLVEAVRDAAASRLRDALPDAAGLVDRTIIGRDADGGHSVPISQRVRIVPLPSIGSAHVDRSIRRILVETPADVRLPPEDVDWAFSGLDRVDPDTGQAGAWVLVRATELDMQTHYLGPSRHWQSVTAVVLPRKPVRDRGVAKADTADRNSAAMRLQEERDAIAAVRQAIRHANVDAVPETVTVQLEPFVARGRRADAFAQGTRFAADRLWHVTIGFDRPVTGPLALGDGRFVGLGVMAPVGPATGFRADAGSWTGQRTIGAIALRADGAIDATTVSPSVMARALRRAVMSRVGAAATFHERQVDTFFSGHPADSAAPDTAPERHLSYHWDTPRQRFLLLAPHLLQRRRAFQREYEHLAALDRATDGLHELRVAAAGRFALRRVPIVDDDPVFAASEVWQSVTPYVVTRHRRVGHPADAIRVDAAGECERLGLPIPTVQVNSHHSAPDRPLEGRLTLTFPVAVNGPIALGRTALLGGGLFCRPARTG